VTEIVTDHNCDRDAAYSVTVSVGMKLAVAE